MNCTHINQPGGWGDASEFQVSVKCNHINQSGGGGGLSGFPSFTFVMINHALKVD